MSSSKYFFPVVGTLALAGAFAFRAVLGKPIVTQCAKQHKCHGHGKCKKAAAASAAAATATAAAPAPTPAPAVDDDKKTTDHNYVSRLHDPKVLPTCVDAPGSFHTHLKYLKFSAAQRSLYAAIATHPRAVMSSSPDESAFLAWLATTLGARRVVEVGVFMGATTLALAQALPADGVVHALDTSKEFTDFGVAAWAQAGVQHKVDLRLAPAADSLQALLAEGRAGTVDLAFIDANKTGYDTYYERCLQLVRRGGVIAVDNVYWHGAIADPTANDADTNAIRAINDKLAADARVNIATIPIADGLTLVTKL